MRPAFLQFWCSVTHCKSAHKKGIPLLFVFLVCLSMFVMSHFLLKIAGLEDIYPMLIG